MADVFTPAEQEVSSPPSAPIPPSAPKMAAKKRKRRKKIIKTLITLVILAGVVTGGVIGFQKLFQEEEGDVQILTDFSSRGSITSMVEGSGVALPKNSASITLTTAGMVEDLYVSEGDYVTAGTALYRISSPTTEEAVTKAQKTVENYQKELNKLYESVNDLNIRAEYAGKLLEVQDIQVGQDVSAGQTIATLVDDNKLRLHQYFSYAYEDDIYVGQSATISIPSSMSQISGTVESINKVERISPEGSVLFEVVLVMNNPDTLTADMVASATLTTSSGETIYPYESGKLEYYRTTTITAKTSGPVEWVNLTNYAKVTAGQDLVRLGAEDNEAEIASLENQLQTAQESLKEAQDNLDKLNAVAPIDGTVLSIGLVVGEEAASGTVAINIADTTTMVINAQIDERNVSYVKTGMAVDIDQWGTPFTGIVESVSLNGKYENGISTFPTVITVDNADGTMMSGSYVNFSFAASQVDDCVIVPIQAVKNVETADGSASVVFVKSETPPEDTVELLTPPEGIPEGFYPVVVKTGISDTYNVEIVSGLDEGVEVFTQVMKSNASSW